MIQAVVIKRSPSERRPGPSKPRSKAQVAATRRWISQCPWQFDAWLKGLTPLPPGWSARGGKLTPPKHALRMTAQPYGPHLPQPYGPCVFDALRRETLPRKEMNRLKDYTRVELKRRSWTHRNLNDPHPEWQAIRAWISHLPNMRRASGVKPAYFRLDKTGQSLTIWFTDANVAFRFFETFATNGGGA